MGNWRPRYCQRDGTGSALVSAVIRAGEEVSVTHAARLWRQAREELRGDGSASQEMAEWFTQRFLESTDRLEQIKIAQSLRIALRKCERSPLSARAVVRTILQHEKPGERLDCEYRSMSVLASHAHTLGRLLRRVRALRPVEGLEDAGFPWESSATERSLEEGGHRRYVLYGALRALSQAFPQEDARVSDWVRAIVARWRAAVAYGGTAEALGRFEVDLLGSAARALGGPSVFFSEADAAFVMSEVLRSFDLVVGDSHLVKLAHGTRSEEFIPSQEEALLRILRPKRGYGTLLAWTLTESSAESHAKLLRIVEPYLHPSNAGAWSDGIARFVREYTDQLISRSQSSSDSSWKMGLDATLRPILSRVARVALHSRRSSVSAAGAVSMARLCALIPHPSLEEAVASIESALFLNEHAHAVVSALRLLSHLVGPLLDNSMDSVLACYVPILVPAIDPNDHAKTVAALQVLWALCMRVSVSEDGGPVSQALATVAPDLLDRMVGWTAEQSPETADLTSETSFLPVHMATLAKGRQSSSSSAGSTSSMGAGGELERMMQWWSSFKGAAEEEDAETAHWIELALQWLLLKCLDANVWRRMKRILSAHVEKGARVHGAGWVYRIVSSSLLREQAVGSQELAAEWTQMVGQRMFDSQGRLRELVSYQTEWYSAVLCALWLQAPGSVSQKPHWVEACLSTVANEDLGHARIVSTLMTAYLSGRTQARLRPRLKLETDMDMESSLSTAQTCVEWIECTAEARREARTLARKWWAGLLQHLQEAKQVKEVQAYLQCLESLLCLPSSVFGSRTYRNEVASHAGESLPFSRVFLDDESSATLIKEQAGEEEEENLWNRTVEGVLEQATRWSGSEVAQESAGAVWLALVGMMERVVVRGDSIESRGLAPWMIGRRRERQQWKALQQLQSEKPGRASKPCALVLSKAARVHAARLRWDETTGKPRLESLGKALLETLLVHALRSHSKPLRKRAVDTLVRISREYPLDARPLLSKHAVHCIASADSPESALLGAADLLRQKTLIRWMVAKCERFAELASAVVSAQQHSSVAVQWAVAALQMASLAAVDRPRGSEFAGWKRAALLTSTHWRYQIYLSAVLALSMRSDASSEWLLQGLRTSLNAMSAADVPVVRMLARRTVIWALRQWKDRHSSPHETSLASQVLECVDWRSVAELAALDREVRASTSQDEAALLAVRLLRHSELDIELIRLYKGVADVSHTAGAQALEAALSAWNSAAQSKREDSPNPALVAACAVAGTFRSVFRSPSACTSLWVESLRKAAKSTPDSSFDHWLRAVHYVVRGRSASAESVHTVRSLAYELMAMETNLTAVVRGLKLCHGLLQWMHPDSQREWAHDLLLPLDSSSSALPWPLLSAHWLEHDRHLVRKAAGQWMGLAWAHLPPHSDSIRRVVHRVDAALAQSPNRSFARSLVLEAVDWGLSHGRCAGILRGAPEAVTQWVYGALSDTDRDVESLARRCAGMLAQLRVEEPRLVVRTLAAMCGAEVPWRVRAAIPLALRVLVFVNATAESSTGLGLETAEQLRTLLLDPQAEVAEAAVAALAAVVRISGEDELAGLRKSCEMLLLDPGTDVGLRRAQARAVGAFVAAHPFGIPQWMPNVLSRLASFWNHRDRPVQNAVRSMFADFWRTHYETWAEDRVHFSPAQCEAVLDCRTGGASVYGVFS